MDLLGLLRLIVDDVAGRLGLRSEPEGAERASGGHTLAMADIVALAALADGQVTREELDTLEATTIGEGELAVRAAERLYALDASAEDVQSPEWLEVKIADLAMALDREERRVCLAHVARLAQHGARLAGRELPSGRVVDVTDRELVALFARGLGLREGDVDQALAGTGS